MTLPRMSSDATPGYPAPEIACIVVTRTERRPKTPQRRQRHRQHHGRTVRVRDDGAAPAFRAPLLVQQGEVVGIDFGHEQRHQRVHPEAARVADDDVAGARELGFDRVGRGGVERGEDQPRSLAGGACLDTHRADVAGQRQGEPPRRGVGVRPPLRSPARPEPGDVEPRMARELPNELLADHPGRAENPDGLTCHGALRPRVVVSANSRTCRAEARSAKAEGGRRTKKKPAGLCYRSAGRCALLFVALLHHGHTHTTGLPGSLDPLSRHLGLVDGAHNDFRGVYRAVL